MFFRRARSAFTLIEILVVVAIIAILAAILFPVFGRARENARRSSCQSNLKQIGLGLLQYIGDYDETMPFSFYGLPGDSDSTANYKWMDAIFPYVKNEAVFNCPSDTAPNIYRFRNSTNYGSYGLNGAYGTGGDAFTPPRSSAAYRVSAASIGVPASTVWVTDNNNAVTLLNSGGSQGFFWPTPSANPSVSSSAPRQLQNIVERHLDTTNVLWCDGHVKALKLDALAKTKTIGADSVMTLFTIEDD